MITLQQLVDSINDPGVEIDRELGIYPVAALTSDSRKAGPGSVFVALKGERLDGHDYARQAAAGNCLAVVVEQKIALPGNVAVITVPDTHRAYGRMAAALYGNPAKELTVIGLTGTNGKTTTSWIVEEMLQKGGYRPAVIGTVNYRYADQQNRPIVREAPLTTPEPVMLHSLLREMKDAGTTHVIMEVSSHALAQQRLSGMEFDVAVFTNLSRDHLDYHRSMEAYFAAKKKLFLEYLKPRGIAVAVTDAGAAGKETGGENWGAKLIAILRKNGFVPYGDKQSCSSYITCGFTKGVQIRAGKVSQDINGFACEVTFGGKAHVLVSGLIGRHNVLNMLTAVGVGMGLGLSPKRILGGLHTVGQVPGRLERVSLPPYRRPEGKPQVFVDYAHTPDALANVLQTLRPVTPGRLFCIFGCGGDRDRGKRPMMAAAAAMRADRIMITSDNPRTEDPGAIIGEIEQGMKKTGIKKTDPAGLFAGTAKGRKYAVLEDRHQAILHVCAMAGEKDVVLVAGKGHEAYQITAAGKRFFDDRLEAKNGRLCWTIQHLLQATSGLLEQQGELFLMNGISTDTRALQAGDVFVALRGEHFDGHDFIATAVSRGAAAVLVEHSCPAVDSRVSIIRVPDTLRALGDLAGFRRKALAPEVRVVAITGSSGKTTVKEMTAAVFEEQDRSIGYDTVLKTKGNLNNLIGLPLSLLQVNAGHRSAVLEMGMNRPGEIERLTGIADPDIGCITNVQAAHLEGLGSIEGVARAKGELFAAMSVGGIRVINYDDPHIRKLGGTHGNNGIGFAVTPLGRRRKPAVRASRIISLGENGMRFTLHINTWQKRFTIPATGTHNVANCTAAAAIATAAGVEPEIIVRGLVRYRSGDKRLQIVELPGGIRVLNDSYNANPSSMAAALRTVSTFGRHCRRVAVLGDMLELGKDAVDAHREIGRLVAELGFDFLAVTGNFAREVSGAARQAGMQNNRVILGETTEDIARRVGDLVTGKDIGQGDWILLKGSRGMRMERVLAGLERIMATDRN